MSQTCWTLNEQEYFEAPGASVLVFHDFYPSGYQSGVEIIQHGERVAVCGDMRVTDASGRWGGYSEVGGRRADPEAGEAAVDLSYPDLDLHYRVRLRADGDSVRVVLDLAEPLDPERVSNASFRMALHPPCYWGKTFHLGGTCGVFPREPSLATVPGPEGRSRLAPLAVGPKLIIAPEDPGRRMVIEQVEGELELQDGRNEGQGGWFQVVAPVPAGATEAAVEWLVTPHRIEGWRRPPAICISQVGYHPDQVKRAIVELDPLWDGPAEAALMRVDADGGLVEAHTASVEGWGRFLRYEYGIFDFTDVQEPGVYFVQYADQSAGPFRIDRQVYREGVWQPTLEIFFPVQMCHVAAWDRGHVWHGACHLDDALQAPAPTEHFDSYRQGPTTDTPYQPHEHIPHLNVGGWHDAGDTDLAAGSQATTTFMLALAREEFGAEADQTTVRADEHLVLLREPDGIPDIVQQVAWGAQCLLGGYRAVGHSFCGIIAGDRRRYHQRGEISTMTDNLVYDPSLAPDERTGDRSGQMDDRWAFTNRDTALEYKVVTALAAASRVLRGYEDDLAQECLETAVKAWDYEQSHPPVSHRSAYVPRGREAQEVSAAAELLITTGEPRYRDRLVELLPAIQEHIAHVGWTVARALPQVGDDAFAEKVRKALAAHRDSLADELSGNPFGVPFHPHIWGIGWDIQQFAVAQYFLTKTRPDLFGAETVLSVLNYVLGCHPGGNTSFVSGVGVRSLTVAFGINRADWSYIPGGVASGTALIRPDFPELKEGFPFLWQQSEYVMPGAATYIFCVLAADALLDRDGD